MANAELVKLGKAINTVELITDLGVILDATRSHKAAFTNLADADVKALESGLAELNKLAPLRKVTQTSNVVATRNEVTARKNAVDALVALDEPLREVLPSSGTRLKVSDFRRGKISESTTKVVDHLKKIVPLVNQVDELLMAYTGEKVAPSKTLDGLRAALEGADLMQRGGMHAAPQETEALNELKGKVSKVIRRVQYKARRCFKDDPAILKAFKTTYDKPDAKREQKDDDKDIEGTPK